MTLNYFMCKHMDFAVRFYALRKLILLGAFLNHYIYGNNNLFNNQNKCLTFRSHKFPSFGR